VRHGSIARRLIGSDYFAFTPIGRGMSWINGSPPLIVAVVYERVPKNRSYQKVRRSYDRTPEVSPTGYYLWGRLLSLDGLRSAWPRIWNGAIYTCSFFHSVCFCQSVGAVGGHIVPHLQMYSQVCKTAGKSHGAVHSLGGASEPDRGLKVTLL
jgi:hypothetical protein